MVLGGGLLVHFNDNQESGANSISSVIYSRQLLTLTSKSKCWFYQKKTNNSWFWWIPMLMTCWTPISHNDLHNLPFCHPPSNHLILVVDHSANAFPRTHDIWDQNICDNIFRTKRQLGKPSLTNNNSVCAIMLQLRLHSEIHLLRDLWLWHLLW